MRGDKEHIEGLLAQHALDGKAETTRWLVGCRACGHWKVGMFPREDIAAWMRVHPRAYFRTRPDDTADSESDTTTTCGSSEGQVA